MDDELLIIAQWGGRETDETALAATMSQLIGEMPEAAWVDLESGEPVPRAEEDLRRWVEAGRSRDSDGTVFPKDGFRLAMITGNAEASVDRAATARVSVIAGRAIGNARVAANSIEVTVRPAWLQQAGEEAPHRFVTALARAFAPWWASAFDAGLVAATGKRIARPRIGYVTYLSDDAIERLAGAEAFRISTIAGGVLLELPQPWSADGAARAVAALEADSVLRPVPALEPAD
jgi:hypothetical protein